MRNLILIAGAAAAIAVPSLSQAATACERSRSDNRVAGTVAGGLLGALAGSAIAGRGDGTAGAIVGGVGGAVVGNQLAKGRPCPAGYVRRSYDSSYRQPRPTYAAETCSWQDQAYRDGYGNITHRQVKVCR